MKPVLIFFISSLWVASLFSQQVEILPIEPVNPIQKTKNARLNFAKDGDLEIYWSEDFSNGLEGQDENGSWTTEGTQGSLWFQTFPVGSENGYDSNLPIPGYGESIPNYIENESDVVVSSPTRENGVMMLDADRFNSTRTSPDDDPFANTTYNQIESALISPSINLTGVEYAYLCFESFSRFCCNNNRYALVDMSADGGSIWNLVDTIAYFKDEYDTLICLDISPILLSNPDLSNCKVRFRWLDEATHYFWSIDDVYIQAFPENDILAGQTWYNNYHELQDGFNAGTESALAYYGGFEYYNTPNYLDSPLNFSMEVYNNGQEVQNDVRLHLTLTDPNGNVAPELVSEPIILSIGELDTITIPNVDVFLNTGFNGNGQFTADFRVEQAEEEEFPEDNLGERRKFSYSTEGENSGYAIMQNNGDNYNGAYFSQGQDVIWGTPYVFRNTEVCGVITHVEAVFQFNENFAETQVGSQIYFNVRSGSVLKEDPETPETISTVFFDSESPLEYGDDNLEFTIEDLHIWDAVNDTIPYTVWATFELPNPILVNSNEVYQAEYRVPPANQGIVYPAVSGGQELHAGVIYSFVDEAWYSLGNNTILTRFRTHCKGVDSVEDLTYENGIQLLQNFPNPFNDITRIQYRLDETADVSFEVFDMAGKLLHAKDQGLVPAGIAQTFNFDRTGLSAGVYSYSIVSNGERVTRKLIID